MKKTVLVEMASFREARLMLLDSYDDGLLDEDELLMLYDINTSKNPVFPYENYERFELARMDEACGYRPGRLNDRGLTVRTVYSCVV